MDLTTRQAAPIATVSSDARVLELWLRDRAPATVRLYRQAAAELLDECGLRAVTYEHLSRCADRRQTDASRRNFLAACKSLLTFAHKIGYLPWNVGAAARLPRTPRRVRHVAESEVLRTLHELRGTMALLCRVLYVAGLRVSEAVALDVSDLESRDHALQLRVTGKGGAERRVLLPAQLGAELDEHTLFVEPDSALFPSPRGGRYTPRAVQRALERACARAGVAPALTPHHLRHAHGTHAVERGAPLHVVQATLGHQSLSTTGVYLHARPSDSSSLYLPT